MAWKRVLITGAAGFLGSHLTDAVLAEGAEVIGVDNLCTGSLDNLKHLNGNAKFSFEQHDICQPFDFGEVDFVLNFASPASPVDYMKLGPETLRVGSDGTVNALEVARKYKAGFLHASTSECYGDPEQHPQKETYWGNVNPIGPRSVYDEAKRFSEATIMAYQRYYGVQTSMVRIFNTYGPRLQPNDGRVISNLMMQALAGEDLTVYGDGAQTRSFCFQSDLVRGILALAKSGEPLPTNIGNPEEWTILECAKTVLEVTGSSSKIVYRPMPTDDPKQRKPDITKARAILGWEPTVNLREGLEMSMDYFKQRIAQASAAK
ncbi:UDP-glucuronic acid decarboxylase family protein [Terriglobus roseus]|uniref:UDP-glucuronate decarboxylase n=1 Tax=Terriglobus roseus TaxID=392734 RepID=A0A1H4T7F4_9BACT|nr:UDP-glucuronic acid decarboxylase family protein [Terriglobus roseus]SEC52210.1 dTDP-glucose 4,6-dehydratase [Terriglobus roseus]